MGNRIDSSNSGVNVVGINYLTKLYQLFNDYVNVPMPYTTKQVKFIVEHMIYYALERKLLEIRDTEVIIKNEKSLKFELFKEPILSKISFGVTPNRLSVYINNYKSVSELTAEYGGYSENVVIPDSFSITIKVSDNEQPDYEPKLKYLYTLSQILRIEKHAKYVVPKTQIFAPKYKQYYTKQPISYTQSELNNAYKLHHKQHYEKYEIPAHIVRHDHILILKYINSIVPFTKSLVDEYTKKFPADINAWTHSDIKHTTINTHTPI
jgi:hypothetical protein